MSEIRLDGQVAVVTGAGRGLGREYALALAARGARVVVNDIGAAGGPDEPGGPGAPQVNPADAVVAEIVAAGGEAVADHHPVDTAGPAVVTTAVETFGRLDVVVNNAGISHGGMFDGIEPEMFRRMLDVHLHATIDILRAAWPHLAATAGRVVNTSSNSTFGIIGTSHYITAKAGIFGLTRALARDGRAAGIKVNAIMPVAYTRMTANIPDERFRAFLEEHFTPDKVAPFVVWLASPDVPVGGEVFSVGGGHAGRVVYGMTLGANADTPEGYAEQVGTLMDLDGHVVPEDATAEVLLASQRLGLGDGIKGAWRQ